MHKFFVDVENIAEEYIYVEERETLKHMAKVLRLRVGEIVEVSDGIKFEYRGEIEEISSSLCRIKIVDKQCFAKELNCQITLFQGVPKQGKMEIIVQKTTELGITEIVPVFMDRTVVNDNGKMTKKIERWQKVCEEAAKQSKRGVIPKVSGNIEFSKMVEQLEQFDVILFPYEDEEKTTIKKYLKNLNKENKKVKNIAVVIGPEGGFSEKESRCLIEKNIQPVSLGKTTLRTETAGMVAISMIIYELEME